jgi:hypothetical protein
VKPGTCVIILQSLQGLHQIIAYPVFFVFCLFGCKAQIRPRLYVNELSQINLNYQLEISFKKFQTMPPRKKTKRVNILRAREVGLGI